MPLTGAAAGVLRLTAVYLLLHAAVGGAAQDGDGVVLFGGSVLRRTVRAYPFHSGVRTAPRGPSSYSPCFRSCTSFPPGLSLTWRR